MRTYFCASLFVPPLIGESIGYLYGAPILMSAHCRWVDDEKEEEEEEEEDVTQSSSSSSFSRPRLNLNLGAQKCVASCLQQDLLQWGGGEVGGFMRKKWGRK